MMAGIPVSKLKEMANLQKALSAQLSSLSENLKNAAEALEAGANALMLVAQEKEETENDD